MDHYKEVNRQSRYSIWHFFQVPTSSQRSCDHGLLALAGWAIQMTVRHVIIVSCSSLQGFFSPVIEDLRVTRLCQLCFSSIGRMLSQPSFYLFTKKKTLFVSRVLNKFGKKEEEGGEYCSRKKNKSGGRWPSSRTWETHKTIIKEGRLEPLNFPPTERNKKQQNTVGFFSQEFASIVWVISSFYF